MALHVRLASHVFPTFDAFKDWVVIQQFDISTKPERAPILKAGQRVFIRATSSVYFVTEQITSAESIFPSDLKGGFLPELLKGQSYIFQIFSQAKTVVEPFTSSAVGSINLTLNENLTTQNAVVTLAFRQNREDWGKSSDLCILGEGNVTLNTGLFSVNVRDGLFVTKYKPGKVIKLVAGSVYKAVLQNDSLVQLIVVGKSAFPLSTSIPVDPNNASPLIGASELAVSEGLSNLNTKLSAAIEDSAGFLQYAGIDPDTHAVIAVAGDASAVDISYAEDTPDSLIKPKEPDLYALVLKDKTSVRVFRSETVVTPIPSANPNYLGEGNYGTEGVNAALLAAYPSAVEGNIVSNIDTDTEWVFGGFSWTETIRAAGDSKNKTNLNYLGTYAPRRSPEVIAHAINMVYPVAKNGSIVNNTSTNTEWLKANGEWSDSGLAIGTSQIAPNPKVSGVFTWSFNNEKQVKSVLKANYGTTLDDKKIILVSGSTEWVYDATNPNDPWSNTGNPAGHSTDIANVHYLGSSEYGTASTGANNIKLAWPNAVSGDVVGNKSTNTDWSFNGETWADTKDALGLHRVVPNPAYGGEFKFDPSNNMHVSAAISGEYPTAPIGNIVYALDFKSEWQKGEDSMWFNTFDHLYTTPETGPNAKIIGEFNYLESWTPPSSNIRYALPNAPYGSYIFNTSTGTEWELSKEGLTWVDTGRPIGTSGTDSELYLGSSAYGTNPPTDIYILPLVFPDATEDQFVHNRTTDTFWKIMRGQWVNTKAKSLNKWLYDQVGVYEWEEKGTSGIQSGYLFHLASRYPETDRSETYWFANSWNTLDFDLESLTGFTTAKGGTIQGKDEFGYIVPEALNGGKDSFGKVKGLTREGTGGKFLADDGTYKSALTVASSSDLVHLYVDFANGNDTNSGTSADSAWISFSRVQEHLASSVTPMYNYTPGSSDYPVKVVVHLAGENSSKDLTVENAPYITIIGDTNSKVICNRLHAINSTVVLDNVRTNGGILAWKSKVKATTILQCASIALVESCFEQKGSLLFVSSIGQVTPISIDSRSSFLHDASIMTGIVLDAAVPFLSVLGTYEKTSNGTFASATGNPLRGTKVMLGEAAKVIGPDFDWLLDNIPYTTKYTHSSAPIVTFNGTIRSMHGTSSKTGFQIADGRDLADFTRGPRGPQGEQGPKGDTGPQGPPGQAPTVGEIYCGGAFEKQAIIISGGNAFSFKERNV